MYFAQEEEPGFVMAPSNFVPTIGEGVEKYAGEFELISSLWQRECALYISYSCIS